ncbi:MAG: HAMP domain-containing histidine kinase [Planctomycetes bacterium]|nr:HAMP domain-containing histidine kinase [Planctomycetota bacterium]
MDTDDSIQLKVTDNGVGIPADHIDRIFDPFFTTKDTGDGTGLGLYVVHAIVQRHGGEISAESSGSGTTFVIRMPKSAAAAPTS